MSATSRTTGRAPSINLDTLGDLLTRYFDASTPSVAELADETGLCEATVRKYLRLALGGLPRGKAMLLPREPQNVQALLNAIPTEAILGEGRVELFRRRVSEGHSQTQLAEMFGISRRRVKGLLASL